MFQGNNAFKNAKFFLEGNRRYNIEDFQEGAEAYRNNWWNIVIALLFLVGMLHQKI